MYVYMYKREVIDQLIQQKIGEKLKPVHTGINIAVDHIAVDRMCRRL